MLLCGVLLLLCSLSLDTQFFQFISKTIIIMPPRVPASVETVESIHRLADIVARFGADKEHIARESIAKNKFHFLNANADRIGFVYYEWVKGEKLIVASNASKRKEKTLEEASHDDNAKKRRRNPSAEQQQQQQTTLTTRRPIMKIAILDVVKTHLQPLYANKDVTKDAYKTICRKTCEKVMSKEPDVEGDEENVKKWLDEHTKKKIRGLVEIFVEKARGGG